MPSRFIPQQVDHVIRLLAAIRDDALEFERRFEREIDAAADGYRVSARNLLHYVSMRRHDLRELQRELTTLGLSSLGRLEAHTMAGIDAVLAALHRIADRPMDRPAGFALPVDFRSGPRVLAEHTEALLGPPRDGRAVRIMVTMPSEAAHDPKLVRDMLEAGMDVMRINCAHDDAATWRAMVANLRLAEQQLGRSCRVQADLSGPKLRTGPLESDARVLKVRPTRDVWGAVRQPALVWFTPVSTPATRPAQAQATATVPFDGDLAGHASPGDVVELSDSRRRRRRLRVVSVHGASLLCDSHQTVYFAEGAALTLRHGGQSVGRAKVSGLAPVELPIVLRKNDELTVTRDASPGRQAGIAEDGSVLEPARIGCTLGDAFDDVEPGHRIFFDDGKIGGLVTANDGRRMAVRITHAPTAGAKLRADKGINLPDSDLRLPALTDKDKADLDFAIAHADIVSLSFVRRPEDVVTIEDELRARGGSHLGVVVKIETRQGFENLPRILLACLHSPPTGVMVARGDLAVEVGFERLAEVQEEILWLCEAAHVPVIWATQVLENLAKTGSPSRAEVTDAAMGVRAECVMLNKGPYVVDAVRCLSDILERMQEHQQKKRTMLRRLSVSRMGDEAAVAT